MVSPYIGGIGQGIGTGLQNLAAILLERQQRQRDEESAQSLMQMLALLMGDEGGAGMAPGGQGGGILPEVSTPKAPIPSGITPPPTPTGATKTGHGKNAFLTALSSGKLKPKTPQEAAAYAALFQSVLKEDRESEREREKEARDQEFELKKIGLIGERQTDLEKLRQRGDIESEKAKAGIRRGEAVSKATGAARALLPGQEAITGPIIEQDPIAALSQADVLMDLLRGRGRGGSGDEAVSPEDAEAVDIILRAGSGTLERTGLPLTPEERGKVAKSKRASAPALQRLGSATIAMGPEKSAERVAKIRNDWLKLEATIGAREKSAERREQAALVRGIITPLLTDTLFGAKSAEDVADAVQTGQGVFADFTKSDKETALGMIRRYRSIAEKEISAGEVAAPMPPTLRAYLKEDQWTAAMRDGLKRGKQPIDVFLAIRDGLESAGVTIPIEDVFKIRSEFYELYRPQR